MLGWAGWARRRSGAAAPASRLRRVTADDMVLSCTRKRSWCVCTWQMPISRRSLLLGSAGRLWAQDAKFSTDVNLVTLLATVHDREGRVVKNLSREDFTLLDDGRPQTISHFSRESDLPLRIGLLVDTSRSQRTVIEAERRASYTFLDQVLR